jgi:DNA-binding transcriptional LysR family regulator
MAAGTLDAVLLALPFQNDDPAMKTIELFTEPFLAAVPTDHPLAAAEEVYIDELINAGLYFYWKKNTVGAIRLWRLAGWKNSMPQGVLVVK